MRYISIFSGVEAATLAWEPMGWEPVAFAEIDEFPSAVLEYRWPNVPNLGDVSKVDWTAYRGAVDLMVGGSPCQSYSIAGNREGLLDERGRLMYEYVRAVDEVRPRWLLWENVVGVLSQDKGRAFGPSSRSWMNSGMVWHGECWTLNTCEWPSGTIEEELPDGSVRSHSAAGVCFLSDVLETDATRLRRYFLSAKACEGFLNRIPKRGKPLPEKLMLALEIQSGRGNQS